MRVYECRKCGEFLTYTQLPNRQRGQRVRKGCPMPINSPSGEFIKTCGGKIFAEWDVQNHRLIYISQTLEGNRLYRCLECGDLTEKVDGLCLR